MGEGWDGGDVMTLYYSKCYYLSLLLVGWTASAKSGILPMKLITLITKYRLLNPLAQMFYSIFIKKIVITGLPIPQQMTTICITYKGIEKPEN
jgi:hypothetical protein